MNTEKSKYDTLTPLREEIDRIDTEIVRLLNERYAVVHEIGKYKRAHNEPIFVPEREKKVFEHLNSLNVGGRIPPSILTSIYREIMSGSISLEKPVSVAFMGPQASYSHLAATQKFGRSVDYYEQPSISDVFPEVENGRADYGCVPVENSAEGVVNCTLDMLITAQTKICAEINIRIRHNLMSICEQSEIQKVYSHPQVFGQCRQWILKNMPGVELFEMPSTSLSAQRVREEPYSAAIASSLASEIYEIPIRQMGIEDSPENTTRFLVLGNQEPQRTGDDKTSICFGIRDRVGALYDVLQHFEANKVTMTLIESRPSKRRNWEYIFFIDLIGHHTDSSIQKTLEELNPKCLFLRVLGSYPRALSFDRNG